MRRGLAKISGITGALLGAAAVVTTLTYPSRTALNATLAAAAFVLLLVFFISHFELFKEFSRKRSTQLGLNSVLMIALFLFIVIVFNLMARQYYLRVDMSSTADYSLAPQTRSVVKDLQGEVKITVFGQQTSPTFRKAQNLLEGYRYLNRNIIYDITDLDKVPLLARQYGVAQYDTVVIDTGREPVVVVGIDEETLTNGIIKARREVTKKIYIIKGHGEKDMNDSGRKGFSRAAAALTSIGYDLSALTLSTVDAVPPETHLIIIAGPEQQFSEEDIAKLADYKTGGGRIIALFDPGYDASALTGMAGIQVQDARIEDRASNLGGKSPSIPVVTSYPDSPITRNFTLSTAYSDAAPLSVGGRSRSHEYFTIVRASETARIVDASASHEAEELIIGAAAGSRSGEDIFVVFGDSDFVGNAFFDVTGNGNFFLNTVNWILEEGDLISITPRQEDFVPLYLTRNQGKIILFLFVIALPLSIFGLGFVIWLKRRRL